MLADAHDLFAQAERHARLAQVVLKGFDDLGIDKLEDAAAALDQGHFDAQGAEHRGVLNADHAAADDDHGVRQVLEAQELVGRDDVGGIEGDVVRAGGGGAGGDDHVVGLEEFGRVFAGDLDGLRVFEGTPAVNERDAVVGKVGPDQVDLGLYDGVAGTPEIGDGGGLGRGCEVGTTRGTGGAAGAEVQDGLAQGLAGDGAGVDGDAPDCAVTLDHTDTFAELGGLNRGLLPGGALNQ